MTCHVPGCSGDHSRSAHVQQRKRTGRAFPVGPPGGRRLRSGEETISLPGLRVSAACAYAISEEAARASKSIYQAARSILEAWAESVTGRR